MKGLCVSRNLDILLLTCETIELAVHIGQQEMSMQRAVVRDFIIPLFPVSKSRKSHELAASESFSACSIVCVQYRCRSDSV